MGSDAGDLRCHRRGKRSALDEGARGDGQLEYSRASIRILHMTQQRKQRDISKGQIDGRSQEIERFDRRSLRAGINLEKLGPRTISMTAMCCRRGGTRTAAITGTFVALGLAIRN